MKHIIIGGLAMAALLLVPIEVDAWSFPSRSFSFEKPSFSFSNFSKPTFTKPWLQSNHGGGSQNTVSISQTCTTTVGQSNTNSFSNSVAVSSATGGNTASDTTGGTSTVLTGDSTTSVVATNTGGFNMADVNGCCDCGDVTVVIEGNGGGNDTDPSPTPTPDPVCEEEGVWAMSVEDVMTGTKKGGSPITDSDRTDTTAVANSPDGDFYSVGRDGWIVVGFDEPIVDTAGDDVSVHEVTNGRDTYPEEKAIVKASEDGSSWVSLGTVSNQAIDGIGYVDLADGGLSEASYIKILDDTDYSLHGNDADGYDLDAVDAVSLVCEE